MCLPDGNPRCRRDRIINELKERFEVWLQERNAEGRREFLGRDVAPPGVGGGGFLRSDETERIEEERGIDSNRQEESLEEISRLVKDLLMTNQKGDIDRELMRKKSLQFSQISIVLLEISMIEGEISDALRNKLSENISMALQEILC